MREKKNGKPYVRDAAEATGRIFGAPDNAGENSDDSEPSEKVPAIFEVEWRFRWKGVGQAGDRKGLRRMFQQR